MSLSSHLHVSEWPWYNISYIVSFFFLYSPVASNFRGVIGKTKLFAIGKPAWKLSDTEINLSKRSFNRVMETETLWAENLIRSDKMEAARTSYYFKKKWKSLSHVWPFVTPWSVACQTPLSMESSGENTRVGSHSLLQGIFLTQGSNLGLPHCRQILDHLSHQGSPFPVNRRKMKHESRYSSLGLSGYSSIR